MKIRAEDPFLKMLSFALAAGAIAYSCNALIGPSNEPSAADALASEPSGQGAEGDALMLDGAGVLIQTNGQRRLLSEVVCQALYDRDGILRGYFAAFEEREGAGMGLRIRVSFNENAETASKFFDTSYPASARWYADPDSFESELSLKEHGRIGSLRTPNGQFSFKCARGDETDRYRNRRSSARKEWLRSFDECDDIRAGELPLWKRWLCKVRP